MAASTAKRLPVNVVLPQIVTDSAKPDYRGASEREWCAFAMKRNAEWLACLGLERFDTYCLEHQTGAGGAASGGVRFDAVGWLGGKAYLIEAKTKCSITSMMAGVGQLLHYGRVARSMGWEVADLIVISPAWPTGLVDAVEEYKLPVSLAMLSPQGFFARRSHDG